MSTLPESALGRVAHAIGAVVLGARIGRVDERYGAFAVPKRTLRGQGGDRARVADDLGACLHSNERAFPVRHCGFHAGGRDNFAVGTEVRRGGLRLSGSVGLQLAWRRPVSRSRTCHCAAWKQDCEKQA